MTASVHAALHPLPAGYHRLCAQVLAAAERLPANAFPATEAIVRSAASGVVEKV